jgi:hypothetical protein
MYTKQFTECHKVLAKLTPGTRSAETNVPASTWIDLKNYNRVVVIIEGGTVATTLDADIEIATDESGSDLHTLKSITQLGADDDDVIVAVEIRTEELSKPASASGQNYRYMRVETTPSGNCVYSVLVLGFVARYEPVGITEWEEVVS